MPHAKAAAPAHPPVSRHPAAFARDLASLVGAALAIGLTVGAGLLLTVFLLA
jgi:hypothetical protein